MSQRFSGRLDPWRFINAEETLQGQVPLASLIRLAPLLTSTEGEAAFTLVFARDNARRAVIECEIVADLSVICQRCLDPVLLPVNQHARLCLVKGFMEAEQLPADLDPLIMEEDELISVWDIVEDELLLAIPTSPRHDALDCDQENIAVLDVAPIETELQDKENPFAVLAALKGSETKN